MKLSRTPIRIDIVGPGRCVMEPHPKRRTTQTVSVLSAALAAAASTAGIAQGDQPSSAVVPPATVQLVRAQDATEIAVTETEYAISVPTSLAPGTYTFNVTNAGSAPHDLVITGQGVDTRTPILNGGASAQLTTTLDAGSYEFWCSVPGHREQGMTTTVTVG
ncbi:plastocyanin/azurin family copper-binding protein [Nocardia sp. NPDC004151]|uniref:plastocyanin/azurin family copper-binding protein n=1 Tax=Nocardia sp. NPDC004151 TaxID=3364304 RepID=UPI0036A172C7